ncbi:MAG: magnesium transporter [Candidatus Omnitrophica bacterium]|nr:magnesium transporter [Candidatus Omnitrophota bacterium]MDD5488415.1 magnesium transporter [Candidatus Omnitrophota bacterium]
MNEHTHKHKSERTVRKREERIRFFEDILARENDGNIAPILQDMSPEDIAEILGEFSAEEKVRIFKLLNEENAAVVLDDTDPQSRLQILQKIDKNTLAKVLDVMPVDEAADVVEDMPEHKREGILDLMEEDDAEDVEEILSYPEDSAARVMNPEFVSVSEDSDVEGAINRIRGMEIDEDFFYVYVTDAMDRLKGTIKVIKLLTAPKGTLVRDLMETDIYSVPVDEDQEKAAMVMKKYDLFSLPVVDKDNKLVGRITVDDIMDVIEEESGEDISRMTGTIEAEHGTETTIRATSNRLPWLISCMLGSIITGLVIRTFQVTLTEMIALVSFIPVVTATGGNSGVQASTVVVREIALGYMDLGRVAEELWRQFKIALGLGITCGIVLSVIVNFMVKSSLVGVIVGTSIFLVVIWSNFVGVMTPVIFKKINIDPALASGPLITTLNDIIGVFIYLSIATVFLSKF